MKTIDQVISKYQAQIGKANDRVSFLHAEPAAQAAEELAGLERQFTSVVGYNFVWRIGQVLGDASYFTAVTHTCNGVYEFDPARLS